MAMTFKVLFLLSSEVLAADFSYAELLMKKIKNYARTQPEKAWLKKNHTQVAEVKACIQQRAIITINFDSETFFKDLKSDSIYFEPKNANSNRNRIIFENGLLSAEKKEKPLLVSEQPTYAALFLTGNRIGLDISKVTGSAPNYGKDVFVLDFDQSWLESYVTLQRGDSTGSEVPSWSRSRPESYLALFQHLDPLFLFRKAHPSNTAAQPQFHPNQSDETLKLLLDWCKQGGAIDDGNGYLEVHIHRRVPFTFISDLVLHKPDGTDTTQKSKESVNLKTQIETFVKKNNIRLHRISKGDAS